MAWRAKGAIWGMGELGWEGEQEGVLLLRCTAGMLHPTLVPLLLRQAPPSPGQGAPSAAPLGTPAARGHPATPKAEPGYAGFTP